MKLDKKFNQLINMIDFFSQDLHFEQLINYGYPYIHNLLNLEKSAIFILESNNYICKMNIEYSSLKNIIIKKNKKINALATLHGYILNENFEKYFEYSFFETNNIKSIIPIINGKDLLGFIISKDKINIKENNNYNHAVNQIINTTFSKVSNEMKLKKQSNELEKEIYSLNLIEHLNKILMKEKNIEKLYDICIDAIRELTASSYTTLALYDNISELISIKNSRDILEQNEIYMDFKLNNYKLKTSKNIFHIEKDREILKKVFFDYEKLKDIKTEYIFIITDNNYIKGFITIGKPVNNKKINALVIKQVNSITSYIYIALKNAYYIKKIKNKNKENQKQISTLKNLNNAITNINSCQSKKELFELLTLTLKMQFNIEKYMILSDKKNNYSEIDSYGYNVKTKIKNNILKNDSIVEYTSNHLNKYLKTNNTNHNCFVLTPFKLKGIFKNKVLGYLVISKVKNELSPHQVLAIKSIINVMTPILNNFNKVKIAEESCVGNNKKDFLKDLKDHLYEKKELEINFYINYKKLKNPFSKKEFKLNEKIYSINGYIFSLTYKKPKKNIYDKSIEINSIKELYDLF